VPQNSLAFQYAHLLVRSENAMTELQSRDKREAMDSAVEEGESSQWNRDERDLMRLGKKPVLKRNFGFMQILGFSCTVLVTWEGILQ